MSDTIKDTVEINELSNVGVVCCWRCKERYDFKVTNAGDARVQVQCMRCGNCGPKARDTSEAWAAWRDSGTPARRYETVRRLNPRQFTELWQANLRGEGTFDDLVDKL